MQKHHIPNNELESLNVKTDAELIGLTRSGDKSSYALLWERHSEAGIVSARYYGKEFAAFDLVAEAYAKIFVALAEGKGPQTNFRTYLQVTIKNIAADWRQQQRKTTPLELEDESALLNNASDDFESTIDRSYVKEAFQSLPASWQEILWLTEVLQLNTRSIATRLNITPNAVGALSFRAREGLRQAWLKEQLTSQNMAEDCAPNVERLPSFVLNKLSPRALAKTEAHLATCAPCTKLLNEANSIASRLHTVLVPFVLVSTGTLSFSPPLTDSSSGRLADQFNQITPKKTSIKPYVSRALLLVGIGAFITGATLLPRWNTSPSVPTPELAGAGGTSPTAQADGVKKQVPDNGTEKTAPPKTERTNDAVRSALYSLPKISQDQSPVFSFDNQVTFSSQSSQLSGFATPGSTVRLTISSATAIVQQTSITAQVNGAWYAPLAALADGDYTARISQKAPGSEQTKPAAHSFTILSKAALPAPQVTRFDNSEERFLPLLSGSGTPGNKVRVLVNGVVNETNVDENGNWSAVPTRGGIVGVNTVIVRQIDEKSSRISLESITYTANLVTPQLAVHRTEQDAQIVATSLPDSTLVVTDRASFGYLAESPDGNNRYQISADSVAGKVTSSSLLTAIYTSPDGLRVGAPS